MKPEVITINQFGSFAQMCEIDFRSFDSLFLISGDTGSGKTTIFDALMYALYGRVAGTRDMKKLYSAHIDLDDPFVRLQFVTESKRYRITRYLAHTRPKKKGEGFVDAPERLIFEKESDGLFQEVSGQNRSELDRQITSLLGLSADEFEKIVLIPQGQFERFLEAPSADKFDLLARLFPVERYNQAARVFRDAANEMRSRMKSSAGELERLQEIFDPRSYEQDLAQLDESIAACNSEIADGDEKLKGLYRQTEKARKSEELLEKIQRLELEKDALKKAEPLLKEKKEKYEKGLRLVPLLPVKEERDLLSKQNLELEKEIGANEEKLSKMTVELREQTAHLDKVLAFTDEVEEKRLELAKIDELAPLVESRTKLEKDRAALDTQNLRVRSELESLQQKLRQNEEKQKALTLQKEQRESTQLKKLSLKEKVVLLEQKVEKEEKFAKLKMEIARCESESSEATKSLDLLEKEVPGLEKSLDDLEKEKADSAVSSIAGSLTEGRPCPVCGSTHHPHPADIDTSPFADDEKLKETRALLSEKTAQRATLTERLNNLKLAFESCNDQKAELAGITEGNSAELLKPLQKELRDVDKVLRGFEKLDEELDQCEKKLQSLKHEVEKKGTEERDKEKQLIIVEEKLGELSKRLGGYSDSASLEKKGLELKDFIERFDRKRQELESLIKEHSDRLIVLRTQIEESHKQLTAQKRRTVDLDERIVKELSLNGFNSLDEAGPFFLDKPSLDGLLREIEDEKNRALRIESEYGTLKKELGSETFPAVAQLEKEYAALLKIKKEVEVRKERSLKEKTILMQHSENYNKLLGRIDELQNESKLVGTIAADLNGSNPRNMTFQAYVMASYLEKIIEEANVRLSRLSNGQYYFVRRREKEKGTTKSGLEFDIVDVFGGVSRKVQTLSGGEKFLASLSLALGLSDVVRSMSGVSHIDSLFIDEGFGSLDEKTLERAVEILDEIREERLTGVISHVAWLKEQIPDRIEVIKKNGSSTVRITAF